MYIYIYIFIVLIIIIVITTITHIFYMYAYIIPKAGLRPSRCMRSPRGGRSSWVSRSRLRQALGPIMGEDV